MNYSKTIKGDTKENTDRKDVCYKNTIKKGTTNYCTVQLKNN